MANDNASEFECETNQIRSLMAGNGVGLGEFLNRDRDRLRRMVMLRLDGRISGRVDPSDVIQEAQLEATRRLPEFLEQPTMPFFLWLRLITGQKILELHRTHLGAQARDARREKISLHHGPMPEATSAALAANLMGRRTDPPDAAIRAEIKMRLQEGLNSLDEIDREVLTLRHFEHLSTSETAQELGITEAAAKKRHLRAIRRLRLVLDQLPGGTEEFRS